MQEHSVELTQPKCNNTLPQPGLKKSQLPFGANKQVAMDNKLTNIKYLIKLDETYLRPLYNRRGVHEWMKLQTGQVITGYTVKGVHVTNLVIKAVKSMVDKQEVKTLK